MVHPFLLLSLLLLVIGVAELLTPWGMWRITCGWFAGKKNEPTPAGLRAIRLAGIASLMLAVTMFILFWQEQQG